MLAQTLTLAQLPLWSISLLVVLYVLISVVLVLAVLIQRPQGGGLSTAFGAGAGSGQTAFGTKIGDALTIFTIVVFTLFLGASIALVFLLRPDEATTETPSVSAPAETPGTPIDQLPQTPGTEQPANPNPEQPTGQTPEPTPAPAPEQPAGTGDGTTPAQPPTNEPAPVTPG